MPGARGTKHRKLKATLRAACVFLPPALLGTSPQSVGLHSSGFCSPALEAASLRRQVASPVWGIRDSSTTPPQILPRHDRAHGGARRSGLTSRGAGITAASARVAGSVAALVGTLLWLGFQRTRTWLRTPSRPYSAEANQNSVRSEYDQWTREGVLEHYWGEHIHMGSYTPMEKQDGYNRDDNVVMSFLRASFGGYLKNFKAAKLDFTIEMLKWSGATSPAKILDVGCGIGGSSRYLAKRFPDAEVLGITLSPEQVERASELAKQEGLTNVKFQVTNALDTGFDANSFDLVWGCESGEHMPDKNQYIKEMARVLKPGGNLVVATWCQRDPDPPFTEEEKESLQYVYDEWSHPYFISISDYAKLMEGTGVLKSVETDDWTEQTLPSWRHSIWVGVWSPWFWMKVMLQRPKAFLGFLRDAYCLERYHRDMRRGLLTYGMMKAVKG